MHTDKKMAKYRGAGLGSYNIQSPTFSARSGFTLIELMIVVAIIAILATLGVTNFSTALRKARDAKRQSDIIAVQKALETCYRIRDGKYMYGDAETAATWAEIVTFVHDNGCLNESALDPQVDGYNYYGEVRGGIGGARQTAGVQGFVLCANLETNGGNKWGTIGADTEVDAFIQANCDATHEDLPFTDDDSCKTFCVQNSQ